MGCHRVPGARFEPPAVRAIGRERVDRLLDRAWEVPLTVVVGPAGAGKTTAAGHLVHRNSGSAVWYRAHPVDGVESVFAEHLAASLARVLGREPACRDLATLLADIEGAVERLVVVIDEFDSLSRTQSEVAFASALADLPPTIHFVSLSRQRPSMNLSRLRVGAGVTEIGPNDLRFRSWEIDRLYRELYRRPLLPHDVAELERRTGGWIAALQLFNIATTMLAPAERRAAMVQVGRRSGPDWDFLADNVLKGLSDDLQLFLLETSPLERLSESLCDALLDEQGSVLRLAELERLQLVAPSMEAPGTFRVHEVLRAHLDGLLLEWEGNDAARKRYRRAAETLERQGMITEALRAYCRGEDWQSALRVLGSRGADVADHAGTWVAALPRALVDNDPWLLLADARRLRADGRLDDAIERYQRVERCALSSGPLMTARRERLLLTALVDHSTSPSVAWVAALRDALTGDPITAVAHLASSSPLDLLAKGLGTLLAGEVEAAAALLRRVGDSGDASPIVSLVGQLALLVAAHLRGDSDRFAADDLERAALALEIPFLARLCRAADAMVAGRPDLGRVVVADSDRAGDAAGAAIVAVLAALGAAWGPRDAWGAEAHRDAAERCHALGLRTLAVWGQVAVALAAVGSPGAEALAIAAESSARRRGLPVLQELAEVGVRAAQLPPAASLAPGALAARGFAMPSAINAARGDGIGAPEDPAQRRSLRIECLGRFVVSLDGAEVRLDDLRPRARAVLRMLGAHVGTGLHRQTLCDLLWPDDDELGASRKLQVAISSIRRVLEQQGASDVLRRSGDVYRLDPDHRVTCDVPEFSRAVSDARATLARGERARAVPALRRAMELYGGDLLPDDGAAEWVLPIRGQLQAAAREVALALGTILLEQTQPAEAVTVCRWGLAIDRFSDPLWRLLADALEADGDLAGGAVARASYDEVLAELGIVREGASRR